MDERDHKAMNNLLNNPNVKLLIDTFDLDPMITLEITKLSCVNGCITIEEITVKQNGAEVRKADLNKLFLLLKNKTITIE